MFAIFFTGEEPVFLDTLPDGQNMDSYCFCNSLLEGLKVIALAGTGKSNLIKLHAQMDNCKAQDSKLAKRKPDQIQGDSMGPPAIFIRYCTFRLVIFR
jgi:hypothetical protein